MYPRNITEKILELQAKGYSAELTKEYLEDHGTPNIHLNTIYNHRRGTVSQEITDELVRQQQLDITLANQKGKRELAMKYRNELLKLLIPQRIEQMIEGGQNWTVTLNDNSKRTDVQSAYAAT
ncbi:hypothetical protein E4G67_05400 [Candidatus Bathyarchaeota archaeon]|nr:MAG: hypothetical protein E4G67_05400 [Candidatus Bathyarchaeota archaeon]